LLTVKTPLGRKARAQLLHRGGATVRVKPGDLTEARVQRVPRVIGVRGGRPLLADGRTLEVSNVIWCTGFHPGFSWIELPVLDEHGEPRHECGVVPDSPGLYFVGLHFLYAMSSTMIHGVGRDAARIADAVLGYREHLSRQPHTRRISGELPQAAE
jgi:putative flavoprotein involved in K+ transport